VNHLKMLWTYLRVTFPDWAWLPAGVLIGTLMWAFDAADGTARTPAWVHLTCALVGTGGAHRAHLWLARRSAFDGAADDCPHPDHRIRHIHGLERIERLDDAVAQCMECRAYFDDWPGGDHDATRCWTPDYGRYR